jgi:hypothetical protein
VSQRVAGRERESDTMPNETQLKRLISDAIFEAHLTHGRPGAGGRLHISREDSMAIASAVFDALNRAGVLVSDDSREAPHRPR